MRKKKHLRYPMKCDKCGKPPEIDYEKSNANWTVYSLNCECGGRIHTDYCNPYYEEELE